MAASQKICPPGTCKCDLIWGEKKKESFADEIKDLEVRHPGSFGQSQSKDECPLGEGPRRL